MDSFKTKKIDKNEIVFQLKKDLKTKYAKKNFQISFESSAGSLNLQIADFICSTFYDQVFGNNEWFELLKSKLQKIVVDPLN